MTMHSHLLAAAFCLFAVMQDQGTRQIIPEEFVKARPGKATTKRPAYRPAATARPAKADAAASQLGQLGLTLWRLRPSTAADSGARIIVHHETDTEEWTPERIAADTPLRKGERIRFSFEAPQPGYLYVIDREQYADGSLGEPFLVFPTTRTRGGDNTVAPGRIIEIPAQDDRPNYFNLKQSRLDQTGEMLTVIVTDKPLEGITIGAKALRLAPEQLQQWERMWGAKVERFEMANGIGKTWTKAEQEAGANVTRELTQDEPGPQTIYRVAVKPGAPLLIKVGLRYGKPQLKKSSR